MILFLLIILCIICGPTFKKDKFETAVKTLIVQASRWSIAADQDQNAFIANLHANYGVGYASALRQIASDSEIKKIANINAMEFEKKISNTQRRAAQKLMKECPVIIPKNLDLSLLSQLEV
jgi:hypothetical protein